MWFYAASFFLISTTGFAKSLSLEEIFEVAKQRVDTISQQRSQVESARAGLQYVKSGFYPNVAFLLNYSRQQIPDQSQNGAISPFFNPDQVSTKFSATMTGLQGFREVAAYRSAQAGIQAQEALLAQVFVTLYTQISNAYYAYLGSKQDFKNLQDLEKAAQERVSEIQKFVNLGRSRLTDLLMQETQVALLLAGARQAQQTLKTNEDILRTLSGIDAEDDIAENHVELPTELEPFEQILNKIEDRPDIKALKAQVEASEQTANVVFGGQLPTLGLGANYYPYRTGVLQPVHWDVGFSLNVPLFQGFGVVAQHNQAKAVARASRYALLQARRDAEKQIRTNYDTLNGVIKTLPLLKKAVETAQKNYKQQVIDYHHKLNTNLDVNSALTQLSTLMRSYDQTWYQGKAAVEALKASVGQVP